jgi:hypothetical protein
MTYENEICNKFYIIVDGEFVLSKRVYKPLISDDPKQEFLKNELVRLQKIKSRCKKEDDWIGLTYEGNNISSESFRERLKSETDSRI